MMTSGNADRQLKNAPWLTAGPASRVLALLDCDGEEARAVGGAVRNALLGEPVGEIDIATTAVPDEVIARAKNAGLKTIPTGIAHGTVTIISDGHPFEVTTLREDVETFGRQARVQFGRDWKRDAERRDFTMNALSASRDGAVHDYVGGCKDVAARRVRFIGDPATRIAEDFLRILRFFRIHASYGAGDMDRAGLEACTAGRAGLDTLSAERVRAELFKLLVAKGALAAVEAMSDWGLLVAVTGGVPCPRSLGAMIDAENKLALEPDPVRRLAALMAFIPDDAARLTQHLRLSRADTARLESIASQFWLIDPSNEAAARALLYRIGAERYRDRILMAWARGHHGADDKRWRGLVTLPQRWSVPSSPFQSADFMARGLSAGPKLGQALALAETEWIAAGFPDGADVVGDIAEAAVTRYK